MCARYTHITQWQGVFAIITNLHFRESFPMPFLFVYEWIWKAAARWETIDKPFLSNGWNFEAYLWEHVPVNLIEILQDQGRSDRKSPSWLLFS
jgi:hypothetical protein